MFYKLFAKNYHKIFPLKNLKKQFLLKYFKNDYVLEIGCGVGQTSEFLFENNFKVSAIDLDSLNIEIAKSKFENENKIEFFQLNMLDIESKFNCNFHSILSLGNVLVHLNSIEEIEKVLNSSFNLLKKNGVFVGQIVNYDRILQNKVVNFPIIETEEFRFERKYDLETIPFKVKFTINYLDKLLNKKYENSVELLPVKFENINRVLKNVGFSEIKYFGDFDEREYTLNSPALIFVAYKK